MSTAKTPILKQLKEFKFKIHLYYWILPFVIVSILMLMYFSGIPWMVEFTCPKINREFGAIENIQLLTILGIIFFSFKGAIKKEILVERIIYFFIGLFAIFIFMEEIDYGAHYLQYFTGEKRTFAYDLYGRKNVHNAGIASVIFKYTAYSLIALFFLLLPMFKDRVKNGLLRYIIPIKVIILTSLVALVVNLVPKILTKTGMFDFGRLTENLAEFSEIMVYYIFFLYLFEMVHKKYTTPEDKLTYQAG